MSPDTTKGATTPRCKECNCQTGGGEYCYEHAPYMVWPLKDGSFRSDRNGRHHVWLVLAPSAESELAALRVALASAQQKVEAYGEQEDRIVEALGPRDRDIMQRIHQLREADAALADLVARLRTLEQQMRAFWSGAHTLNNITVRKWADTIAALLRHEGEQP